MNPCFPNNPQGFQFFQQEADHGLLPFSHGAATTDPLSYHVSVLRDKVQQLERLVGMVVSSPAPQQLSGREAAEMAASTACAVLQEIAAAASAVAHRLSFSNNGVAAIGDDNGGNDEQMFANEPADLFGAGTSTSTTTLATAYREDSFILSAAPASTSRRSNNGDLADRGDEVAAEEVVELDASYLLARYTHYCHVCGKGFKRDANLRMHMRAHGDEYKTSAALSNPLGAAAAGAAAAAERRRSYSCPAEGCRWNSRHPRFQPLKSLVCAKNHYRRSHCPKMYACQRCDGDKQFAVLSDLRTHEKHCGELRWRCSCGTFFSRKDKLMGHVALFATGHAPVPTTVAAAAAAPTTTARS
ncbi:hypothetical protein BS78_06G025200 [Paspalum vaginatum]|nr:hypothetical protein BS78_06G025200 [Paspalum vaginatum]